MQRNGGSVLSIETEPIPVRVPLSCDMLVRSFENENALTLCRSFRLVDRDPKSNQPQARQGHLLQMHRAGDDRALYDSQ